MSLSPYAVSNSQNKKLFSDIAIQWGGGFVLSQIRGDKFRYGIFRRDPCILCSKFCRHSQKCCGV